MRVRVVVVLIGFLFGAIGSSGIEARDGAAARAFRIGYLDEGCDLADAAPEEVRRTVRRLKEALLADPEFSAALEAAGFGEILLRPCDGPFDMIQRLGVEEFDLAFSTAVIYGRLFLAIDTEDKRSPATSYEPVLQFRFVEPVADVDTPNGTMRRGAVFRARWAEGEDEQLLSSRRWAVPDAYSAGGYIYPILEMERRFPDAEPGAPLFCGSEESAIKHVVAGLTPVGATAQRVLQKLERGPGAPAVEEIFATDLFPSDPILLHEDFSARAETAEVGRAAVAVMVEFFGGSSPEFAGVRVNKAQRRAYELMARALREFDRITGRRNAGGAGQ